MSVAALDLGTSLAERISVDAWKELETAPESQKVNVLFVKRPHQQEVSNPLLWITRRIDSVGVEIATRNYLILPSSHKFNYEELDSLDELDARIEEMTVGQLPEMAARFKSDNM